MNISDQLRAKGFVSEQEAAAYLGVKASTLKFWRSRNRGPRFFKPCGHAIYLQADLDAYVENSARIAA